MPGAAGGAAVEIELYKNGGELAIGQSRKLAHCCRPTVRQPSDRSDVSDLKVAIAGRRGSPCLARHAIAKGPGPRRHRSAYRQNRPDPVAGPVFAQPKPTADPTRFRIEHPSDGAAYKTIDALNAEHKLGPIPFRRRAAARSRC